MSWFSTSPSTTTTGAWALSSEGNNNDRIYYQPCCGVDRLQPTFDYTEESHVRRFRWLFMFVVFPRLVLDWRTLQMPRAAATGSHKTVRRVGSICVLACLFS
jgi:hypothetical protein